MLNVSKLVKLDLSTIDMRTITPEEREAVICEVIRRAQVERAKVMRDLVTRLRSWWQDHKRRRGAAVQADKKSLVITPGR